MGHKHKVIFAPSASRIAPAASTKGFCSALLAQHTTPSPTRDAHAVIRCIPSPEHTGWPRRQAAAPARKSQPQQQKKTNHKAPASELSKKSSGMFCKGRRRDGNPSVTTAGDGAASARGWGAGGVAEDGVPKALLILGASRAKKERTQPSRSHRGPAAPSPTDQPKHRPKQLWSKQSS